MSGKTKSLSTLVENQLPQFISGDYPMFVEFVKKYYEQLELKGQPLDIINNFVNYLNIDNYSKEVLKQYTNLTSSVLDNDTTINVSNTAGFPETNGYLLINNEAIFYKSKTPTSFVNCYRNVSATTKLGDLYKLSETKNVLYDDLGQGQQHASGTKVLNISNLFFYAFIKNFESQYLASFPEESLKPQVDKKNLIKNIKQFYKSKGTDQSISFIFNSIVSQETTDIPTVYYPKDSTFKSSGGKWIKNYSLRVKLISGNPYKLIGKRITQYLDPYNDSVKNAFGIVDSVSTINGEFYEINLAENTVVGNFKTASQTFLTKTLDSSSTTGNKINVFSTLGWDLQRDRIYIGNEEILYDGKTINQFTILSRGQNPLTYPVTSTSSQIPVYSTSTVSGFYVENGTTFEVKFIILGLLYNLNIENGQPFSFGGDKVEKTSSGFTTRDAIIFDKINSTIRWKINETFTAPVSSSNASITNSLSDVISDVSSIFEDAQYYYITSSGFPSHDFAKASWNAALKDQKLLKIIKKTPERSTEIYKIPTTDVGVLVNGVTIQSYKDEEDVVFGGVTEIDLLTKGSGYLNPPYVLVEEKLSVSTEAKAISILSGETVDRIEVVDPGSGYFPPNPLITITSGRNAVLRAVVTSGKVTSIIVVNPGEYYSTPPEIRIVDKLGRGKFAKYRAVISSNGQIIECVRDNEEDVGKFYTQENIEVQVIPIGSGATAVSTVRSWKKNRFYKLKNNLDSSYGYFFENNLPDNGYGYSYVANPKALRILLNDNLDALGNVPSTLSHSPILGYAYDGNPIYGPYGYSNGLDSNSSIQRMESSYILKSNRIGGPGTDLYPLGSLIEDFRYSHRYGTLDENNGRFCVTPEYPNGTYAYFITIDSNNNPVFPYLIGENYYSLPVDSNYKKGISQDTIPKNIARIKYGNIPENGNYSTAIIQESTKGSVSEVDVQYSHTNFSVDCPLETDYTDTDGFGIKAYVKSIEGVPVTSLQNYQTKTIKIDTSDSCYFYDGELIRQSPTVYGTLVGNVFDGKSLILRNVSGTFTLSSPIYTDIKVVRLIIDRSSTYTQNSTIKLKNGKSAIITSLNNSIIGVAPNPFVDGEPITFTNSFSNILSTERYFVKNSTSTGFQISSTQNGSPLTLTNVSNIIATATGEKARGIILDRVDSKNSLKIKVTFGEFVADEDYYLESSTLTDSVGSKIFSTSNLSENIDVFSIDDNIALVKTSVDHKLSIGDQIKVDIDPNDSTTETTYYVRRRIYQKAQLKNPEVKTKITDSGVGRLQVLNSGSYLNNSGSVTGDYSNGGNNTYLNIELVFLDQTKCRDIDGNEVGSSSSSAVIGKVGNSNNARATISVTNGVVTSVTITNKGSGYILGDILTASPSSLGRPNNSTNTQNLKIKVDHVGLSASNTTLKLEDVKNISIGDYLLLDKEIVKVSSVSPENLSVTILRSQEGTISVDHVDRLDVTGYNLYYRMEYPYTIGTQSGSAIVKKYDSFNHTLDVVYNLALPINAINKLSNGYTFYDQSTPKKLITVESIIEDEQYKFEFSKDTNDLNYIKNPVFDLQKYYSYKFDTSHFTLTGSFLEFSPSINFNIITTESTKSQYLPGNSGSFIKIKVGYGSALANNNYSNKLNIDFTKFYYFDKAGIISSDNSYLNLIDDPLQGNNTVIYATPTYFAYSLRSKPQWDGSGSITYETTSKTSIGKIKEVGISSYGLNLQRIPIITGVYASQYTECLTDVIWDSTLKSILSVKILRNGYGYSKPKAIISDGDGSGAIIDVIVGDNGIIRGINVLNSGKNYSYKPHIKIIETDVRCYYTSQSIGIPKSIKIESNGYGFYRDNSIFNSFKSYDVLVLQGVLDNSFGPGEEVIQYESNIETARGKITTDGYRNKTNILKITTVSGKFRENLPIYGTVNKNTCLVKKILRSSFISDIRNYVDNQGKYLSDDSIIGFNTQRITDSFFYQDYSYAIKSKTQVKDWRQLVNQTTHTAGFKAFGELSIENPEELSDVKKVDKEIVSIIQLWDENTNHARVISENTRRQIITNVINVSELSVENGKGSVYAPIYDSGETTAYEFFLSAPFDGYLNQSGNRVGTTTFEMKLSSTTSLNVSNINNLFITLDGIFQEPGKAYTISGSQITFNQAPFGYRDSLGASVLPANYVDGVDVPPQKFIGRFIKFKDNTLNSQYFKKIKNISSQFDNTKTTFDLYYEDNSPVTLSYYENLLVSIDGVIQQAGVTPTFPGDRAYYIKRTVTPNQIIFMEPPKTFESTKQSFYAYNVGAYERLEIDYRYVNDLRTGPFIIKSPLTKKSITVDEERNVFVFVDGVLQKRNKSYNIRGAAITFSEPIKKGQKINIVYLFGRDYLKSLVSFDFEQSVFFNYFKISTSSSTTLDNVLKNGLIAYQGTSLYNYSAIATLRDVEKVYGSTTKYRLYFETAQNKEFSSSSSIILVNPSNLTTVSTIPSSEIVSVDPFTEDGDTLDVLKKTKRRYEDFIKIGDEIKVDGESEFRKVLTIPDEVTKTEYRSSEDVNSGYVGKIGVTSYNGEIEGEGLDVVAIVENGKVVKLDWNKKEWDAYFDQGIVPTGAGYGYVSYPIIKFVPQPVRDSNGLIVSNQPAQGGGAEGYAITNGNEIIDVVLTNSGSGYLTSPKVYITRQYKLKRVISHENIVNLNIESPSILVNNITVTSAVIANPAVEEFDVVEITSSEVAQSSFGGIQNIEIISPDANVSAIPSEQQSAVQNRLIQIPAQDLTVDRESILFTSTIEKSESSISSVNTGELLRTIPSGVVDTKLFGNLSTTNYTGNILGNRWTIAASIFYLDPGIANVSGLTIGEFNDKYPNVSIEDLDQENLDSVLISSHNYIWDNGYPSSQEYGTYLQTANLPNVGEGGYLSTGAIVYAQKTSAFPSSGYILVDKEIISYTGKLSDRFTGCTRGVYGPISSHTVGAYIRSVSAPV